MSYIDDQEGERIRYQKLAEQSVRSRRSMKLWVFLGLGMLVALIAGVVVYWLSR